MASVTKQFLPCHNETLVRKLISSLSHGLIVFGSLAPQPRDFRCPVGGSFQIILRFRVNSKILSAFKASKSDGPLGPGCCPVVSLSTSSRIASKRSSFVSMSIKRTNNSRVKRQRYCVHALRINKSIIQVSNN